jgi:DNA-binding Lrp family transcriptional regulator
MYILENPLDAPDRSTVRRCLMQAKAFVLIETAVGRNKDVANALKKLNGMKSVDIVTGPYDIIAIMEGDSLNDIGDLVTGNIHPIAGISRTVTCLSIKGV